MFLRNTIKNKINIEGKKIYKFIPLNSNLDENIRDKKKDLDYKRIDDLLNNKFWFSKYKSLNDPFEMQSAAYYKNKNEGVGACQQLNNYLNLKQIAIASFCSDYNIMPMWAHYANNHKGYCLEFEIVKQDYIFPVEYKENREKEYRFSSISANTDKQKELWGYQLSLKAKDWEYEQELRMIICDTNEAEENGKEIDIRTMGLTLSGIIIGANCSENNKKILKKCCEIKGIQCYQSIVSDKKFEVYIRKTK